MVNAHMWAMAGNSHGISDKGEAVAASGGKGGFLEEEGFIGKALTRGEERAEVGRRTAGSPDNEAGPRRKEGLVWDAARSRMSRRPEKAFPGWRRN